MRQQALGRRTNLPVNPAVACVAVAIVCQEDLVVTRRDRQPSPGDELDPGQGIEEPIHIAQDRLDQTLIQPAQELLRTRLEHRHRDPGLRLQR